MKITKLIFSAAIVILAAGCVKEVVPEINVNPSTITFEIEGGTQTITVSSNTDWTVSSDAAWLKVSPATGNGNGQVTLTAAENTGLTALSAKVKFTNGTLTKEVSVSQKAMVPFLKAGVQKVECASEGGDYTISVSSNVAWTVSVAEDAKDWISLDKTSGEGDSSFTAFVTLQRELVGRSAIVTLAESVTGTKVEITFDQAAGSPSRYTDSLALVAIYNASNGAEWAKNNWDLSTPLTEWKGIRLNVVERVDSLRLATKVITAADWTIPAEIGNLDELVHLTLGSNRVSGELPAEIYKLTRLNTLDLSNNNLSGSFTSEMGVWENMGYITMLNNKEFGGTIPAEIGKLKNLFRFNLSGTSITGASPVELAGCESLQEFMAFGCKLTGELPDIWDQFKKDFKILMLYGNEGLTGPLPASLGKIVSSAATISYHLYNCNFTGNVPESFGSLPAGCKQLRIQGNKMSGVVPDAVRNHANWATWKAEQYIFPQQEGYGLE